MTSRRLTILAALATAAAAVVAYCFGPSRSAVSTYAAEPAPQKTEAVPPAHKKVHEFLTAYCIKCHGPTVQKTDRRFDQLTLPAANADALTLLNDIVDQLNLGEMPPKKAKQPSADRAQSRRR